MSKNKQPNLFYILTWIASFVVYLWDTFSVELVAGFFLFFFLASLFSLLSLDVCSGSKNATLEANGSKQNTIEFMNNKEDNNNYIISNISAFYRVCCLDSHTLPLLVGGIY